MLSIKPLITPTLISKIFDRFPIFYYDSIQVQSPLDTSCNLLFIQSEETLGQKPSYDLESLRWQTYFIFSKIPHLLVPSTPYASSSNKLPFFIPSNSSIPFDLSSTEFQNWLLLQGIKDCSEKEPLLSADIDSYISLIENTLYDAWYYGFFIEPENFRQVTSLLYIKDAWPVSIFTKWQLQNQIKKKLSVRQKNGLLNAKEIYADASHALHALSIKLGQDQWFFGTEVPSYIDATLFAYTYLVLSINLPEDTLSHEVKKYENLVKHAERVSNICFPNN
ncbi:hypothetical protein T552_01361 [Pneumocystis carinii B80]|uniref:Metaxin glutathione S-transferase domain-containing protein n=1 Tax=Pneumocystis carinii (strain B80) TaxID=1408658 RepID=A0A0W4ZLZ9_PNEC8|nr:hypothetical protein T552_01361 [Pneumocystis carinii B80]KTW29409.1 hypothetical protein T552_01361 [Pneumocystis carinii B80]